MRNIDARQFRGACGLKSSTSLLYIKTGYAAIENVLNSDERGSKIARNIVFNCHLSPVGRQMAIENSVSKVFFIYVRQ